MCPNIQQFYQNISRELQNIFGTFLLLKIIQNIILKYRIEFN